MDPLDFSQHFHIKQGFCYPDWDAISRIIERDLPELERNRAWEDVSRGWVKLIRDQLEGDYNIHETANFLILSEAPMRVIRDACKSYEDSLKRILAGLEGVASDEGYGKHVVLMFANLDDYYRYIAYFYPDGESPMSGGVCLSGDGYVHFAFPTVDYSSYRTVLVHELTHGCLGHLPLPAWLNEALAMRMEQVVCESDIFHLDKEVYRKHAAHWDEETIQEFWTGDSWGIPGDSFELSYNLAQVIWRKIEGDLRAPRTEILRFILNAHYADAGETACQAVFDLSLGDLVTDFLGDGNWTPQPTKRPVKLRQGTPEVDGVNLKIRDVTLRIMVPSDVPILRAIYQTNAPEFLPDDSSIVEEDINEDSPN
ncbi:MAG: hypothetical protein ACFCU3_01490 [Verrucomicrobiales bacterium]